MAAATTTNGNENLELNPAAEFQALPLEYIVSAPLVAAVRAQAVVADTTKAFIESMLTGEANKKVPITVDFNASMSDSVDGQNAKKEVSVSAPLLSIVPVPHLRIDSLSIRFKYEITQTKKKTKESSASAGVSVKTGAALSPWVSASLEGKVASKGSEESVMNRSGMLDITVNASEAPIPEGLAKVLGLLSNAIAVQKKQ